MRLAKTSLLFAAAFSINGCAAIDFLTDNCQSEFIAVSWPVTITRGGTATVATLTGSVSPGNIGTGDYTIMKEVLATGGRELLTTVVWSVSAFDVNGGFIALMHPAPLATGQTEPVALAFDGGGWGVVGGNRPFAAVLSVRADNFLATTATGSITATSGMPLRLRIDVTAKNNVGETIGLAGDAQFRHEVVRSSCS